MMAQQRATSQSFGGWQVPDNDVNERKFIFQQIINIFQQRRPAVTNQWNDRLPDFVKRLEEALYRTAESKEDYCDQSTLESRLQDVARRLVERQPGANGAAGPSMHMGAVPQASGLPGSGLSSGSSAGPSQYGPSFGANPGMMPQGLGAAHPPDIVHELPAQPMRPGMPPGVSAPIPPAGPSGADAAGGSGNGFQPGGLVPGFVPSQNPLSSTMMSNGAPVLLRGSAARSEWSAPPNVSNPSAVLNMSMNGAAPPALPNGSMMPAALSQMPQAGPLVPANGLPSLPNSSMAPGQLPGASPGMHKGPAPMSGAPGRMPVAPGMVPVGGSSMPGASSMVPMGPSAMVPSGPGMPSTSGAAAAAAAAIAGSGGGGELPGGLSLSDMTEEQRHQYIQKQQRWLLFLRHCAKCRYADAECQLRDQCKFGKQLWQHILSCAHTSCSYPRCASSKDLLKHHQKCQLPSCLICGPVKEYVRKTRSANTHPGAPGGGMMGPGGGGGSGGMMGPGGMGPNGMFGMVPAGGMVGPNGGMMAAAHHHQQRVGMAAAGHKRSGGGMVFSNNPLMPGHLGGSGDVMAGGAYGALHAAAVQQQDKRLRLDRRAILSQNTGTSLLETFSGGDIETHVVQIRGQCGAVRAAQQATGVFGVEDLCRVCEVNKLTFEPPVLYCTHCGQRIKRGQTYYSTPAELAEARVCWCHGCYTENKGDRLPAEVGANLRKSDLQKRKNDDEVEESWVQCDSCQAWVHQICGLFNKGRNNDDVHYLCPFCLAEGLAAGIRQPIEQRPQAMLESKDLPACNLSNFLELRLNRALEAEHAQRSAAAGTKDVPTADPLTVRVINSVMKRCETKQQFAATFRHGPEAAAASPSGAPYPPEFPYRQKVVVLFQKQDGVDVCLYVMYVQEYGSECPAPNTNCVYLSYLDSVKYFRPEVLAAPGCCNGKESVSLRTFVYHQVLLAYLAYVKLLGFHTMYIWACPPLAGDDYILYCHPAKQKTPRSDRLRHWYLDMLRQSRAEGVVRHITTLWDTYFEGGRDHRLERCSATAVPYLEGDYWPGEAENLLASLAAAAAQGQGAGGGGGGDGAKKGGGAGGGGRKGAKGKRYGGDSGSTDEALMARLGEVLGGNMKEDFIVAHLREPCSFCRGHITSGHVYRMVGPASGKPRGGGADAASTGERKFEGIKLTGDGSGSSAMAPGPTGPISHLQICESCYQDEGLRQQSGVGKRLPPGVALCELQAVAVEAVAVNKDPDPDIESEFFETRQAFLSLCQGNHYQFDTLRRAKHSSMMVLYHIHNPTAPAFTTSCNKCGVEIEPGAGFRCTVCADFDMCASCKAVSRHEHPLVAQVRRYDETRTRLTEKERQERAAQLQRTMALLVHACNCRGEADNCASNSCRKVRQLYVHALQCSVKVQGGCGACKKMWSLLNLHAKTCDRHDCGVPRCRELKEVRRRATARQEEQRRLAYHSMVRAQMAAAGGSSQH